MPAEETLFQQVFSSLNALPAGASVFCRCRFENCRMPGVVLNGMTFEDCTFYACDLSLASLQGTAFKDVLFEECKLQGTAFYVCARWLLAVRFKKCLLRFASFAQLPLKKTVFEACDLQDASFVDTQLQQAVFTHCNLSGVSFLHTHLEGADLASSVGMVLEPENNFLRGAKFSVYSLPGLLSRYGLVVEELS